MVPDAPLITDRIGPLSALWSPPRPNTLILVVATTVATLVVALQSAVRVASWHADAIDGPRYAHRAGFEFFPLYEGSVQLFPMDADTPAQLDPGVVDATVVPPSPGALALDLLVVVAGCYAGFVVLVAAGRRLGTDEHLERAADHLEIDRDAVLTVPAAVRPTWPRLGAVVTLVALDAAVPGVDLLVATLYRASGRALAWAGLSWLAVLERETLAAAAVVAPAVLALLATYLLVCAATGATRRWADNGAHDATTRTPDHR